MLKIDIFSIYRIIPKIFVVEYNLNITIQTIHKVYLFWFDFIFYFELTFFFYLIGLIVSDLPNSFFNGGGITTFEGYANQFSEDEASYKMHVAGFYPYDFDIMSMQWDGNNTLYIMDGLSKSILKMEAFDIWMNHTKFGYIYLVHRGLSYTISSRIAYDHLTGNMYWTDALYNWIAVQPVHANDQSNYKILISDQLSTPGAIAVDPNNE